MARKKNLEKTLRQKFYSPTTFHIDIRLKNIIAKYVVKIKISGVKMSAEKFINEAIKDKCNQLDLL